MNNAKSVRTPTPPELFGDNKSSLLLPQVQVNNQFNNWSTSTCGTSCPSAATP
jgi:hypothetical protein